MVIFGKQCFEYTIHHAPMCIQEIYLSKNIENSLFFRLKKLNVPIIKIDNKKAQSLARGKNHQGVFARIETIQQTPIKKLLDFSSLVVLCGMSDIGNIGAIIRTAYALGIDGVIMSDRDSLNTQALEGIFRTSSGALLNMPFSVHKSSLSIANEMKMKQFLLIGACKNNSNNTLEYRPNKWAIFIGKEDVGLPKKLINKLDYIIHIAMCNGFDSLNASVAAGILIDRIQHIKREHYV